MRVGVIGAGAWGTALGLTAHRAGNHTTLWHRSGTTLETITTQHSHPHLPGILLPSDLQFTSRPYELTKANVIILAVPVQAMSDILQFFKPFIAPTSLCLIAAKGIEKGTGSLMSSLIHSQIPDLQLGVISGPNFATEVAANLPAASTVACEPDIWVHFQKALSHPKFRLYHSPDLIGVQLGGALKNVIAIACGIVKGKGLGENARASLVTRALQEMIRLGQAMGATPETFVGLSGIGDLMLTCMGTQSRNLKLGEGLGQHSTPWQNLERALKTVEGVHTAQSFHLLSQQHQIDMPICNAVYQIIQGNQTADEAIQGLLARPPAREESISFGRPSNPTIT